MIMAMLSWQSCTDLEEEILDNVTAVPNTNSGGGGGGGGGGGINIGAPYSVLFSGTANHNSYFSIQEVSTDEVVIPQRGADWFDGGTWLRVHRHQYTSQEDGFNNAWNDTYRGVFECNTLLQDADVQADPKITAEVKVLRAYFYFRLLDTFGNVKIVTVPGQDASQSPREDVFEFIESEILENIDDLSTGNDASTYGRINRWAASALLAKLYLNAEIYTGTPRWQEAIDATDDIINSGLFGLSANYEDVFSANNTQNGEHIWVVPFDQATGTGFNLAMMTLHYPSQLTFRLNQQPWNGYCSLEEFYNSYDADDERRANNFLTGPQVDVNGNNVGDVGFENGNGGGPADPDGLQINYTPEINQLEPNALRQSGARLFKFTFAIEATENLDNDYPIFRLGDILLTKAEAIARLNGDWNNTESLMLVNMLRERAGVSLYTAGEMDENEFLAERGREVFIEGWRRQDLIRFDDWGKEWWEKPAHDNPDLELFPIPEAQLNVDPALSQNPGY